MTGLGKIFHRDPKDKKFLLPRRKLDVLPRYRYWRTPDPLDQGNTSSCVGHAGWHWLRASPVINKPNFKAFDLYRLAQEQDEPPTTDIDGGATTHGLMKALIKLGLISDYQWAFEVDIIIGHLLAVGPVVAGTNWHLGMLNPDRQGFIHVDGPNYGGHEWLLHGVNLDRRCSDGSTGALRGMNSYGPNWGDKGHMWISIKSMKKLMKAHGDATTATEIRKFR